MVSAAVKYESGNLPSGRSAKERPNISFINATPALVKSSSSMSAQAEYDQADDSGDSLVEVDDYTSKLIKRFHGGLAHKVPKEYKQALAVKHRDPLKYYGLKVNKKMLVHKESTKKLLDITENNKTAKNAG